MRKLPFTTKEDLRLNYPYGMFAVPLREVVRIHSSSGTTGKPTVVGYTKNDIKTWSNLVARFMTAAGVTHDDVVQIAFGYGMFTGAFGLHYGAETIGASVIPMSAGNTEKQIMIMQDYKTTVLVCTPSYAITIGRPDGEDGDRSEEPVTEGRACSAANPGPRRCARKSKRGCASAPPTTTAFPRSSARVWPVNASTNAACTSSRMPSSRKSSTRIPVQVLPPGSVGELVLTTLTKEAFPMIRYRTRDITSLDYSPCACGRTMVRMKKTMGRSDDMLIIKGVNVFPSQIEEVLFAIEGCEPHYQLVVERKGDMDVLEVHIEVTENIFFDEMKKQRAFLEMVEKRSTRCWGSGLASSWSNRQASGMRARRTG